MDDDAKKRRERLQMLRDRIKNNPNQGAAGGGRLKERIQGGGLGAGGGRAGGAGGGGRQRRGAGGSLGGGDRSQPLPQKILNFLTSSRPGGEMIADTNVERKRLERVVQFLRKMESSQRGGKVAQRIIKILDPQEVDGQLIFDSENVNKFVKILESGGQKRGAGRGQGQMQGGGRGQGQMQGAGRGQGQMQGGGRGQGRMQGGGRGNALRNRIQGGAASSQIQDIKQILQSLEGLAGKWSEQFEKMKKEIVEGLQKAQQPQAKEAGKKPASS